MAEVIHFTPRSELEADANVPEVASWVEAQNKVTFAYLEKIPFRQKIKDRLTQLYNYPKYSAPTRRGTISSTRRMTVCRTRESGTGKKVWTARQKFCLIQTNYLPMGRRAWDSSRFRRTEAISATESRKVAPTGTTFT